MELFKNWEGMHSFLESKKVNLRDEISSLSQEALKNSDDSLQLIFLSNHSLEPIVLHDAYSEDGGEVNVDITGDNRFWILQDYPEKKTYKKAKRITLHFPFNGYETILEFRPNTFDFNPPKAEVKNGDILINIDFFSDIDTSEGINDRIEKEKKSIEKWIERINKDIKDFNNNLKIIVEQGVLQRRGKVEGDQKILDSLKIPMRNKENPSRGYIRPIERVSIKLTSKEETTDPNLEMSIYDEITSVLNNLGLNIERCSQTIRSLDEEPIRDIFFSGLNSTFNGLVSSEAFNKSGKTDLLIRYEDKNLYISEFKIWKGEQYISEGIDQLLNNLTWRDSKCSYVLFSRKEDFSTIIEKARNTLKKHKNFISEVKMISETAFRFTFYHNLDSKKQIYLTLHLFNLK